MPSAPRTDSWRRNCGPEGSSVLTFIPLIQQTMEVHSEAITSQVRRRCPAATLILAGCSNGDGRGGREEATLLYRHFRHQRRSTVKRSRTAAT